MNKIVGQLMLIGISGPALTQDEKTFIIENNISGVVLFGRNCINPKQIHELCCEIQDLRHHMVDKAPLMIGIDMEGGRVHRLKPPFTQWPALQKIGDLDAPTVAYNFAHMMGLELNAIGINLDFAPCIDVFSNPLNTVIGDRAISSDPWMVEKMSSALVRGYIKANVINCVKHFPGHGNTVIDSHDDLPIEEADLKRLHDVELVPFKKSFRSKADMTMTAHITFRNIDPNWPVTLSDYFLRTLCRDELNFRGLIITDDLDMKALAKHYDKAFIPVRALQAGNDMLMYCNEAESPAMAIEAVIGAVAQGQLNKAHLEDLRKNVLAFKKDRIQNPDPMAWADAESIVGNEVHKKFADDVRQGIMPAAVEKST